jgi:CRP-like cAMP-binding protein
MPLQLNPINHLEPFDQKEKSSTPHDPLQNAILAEIPQSDFKRLSSYLELVPMPAGLVLYESGVKMQYVYFPTTSVLSLLYVLENGSPIEIAGIGCEGMLGVSLFLGGLTTNSRAVVQIAGFGYRLNTRVLIKEFEHSGSIFRLLLRYTQALMTQMSQLAVCNRHHCVEQQLCRWLLFNFDRLSTKNPYLTMTQEKIGNMLGVRREGVTEAANRLQRDGLIHCSRGKIEMLDRAGIELKACECYKVIKSEFNRLIASSPEGASKDFPFKTYH